MSIDFDSAALQTQHDEEEYDQEDYAREQEVRLPLSVKCNIIKMTFVIDAHLRGGVVILIMGHCCSGIKMGHQESKH